MKRIIIYILTLFLLFINISANAAENTVKKEIKAIAEDGFNIEATLTYPKVKNKKEFPTVILLHSLGYNSQWWETLPSELSAKGYAVLAIDLRGHGASIYNSKLTKTSWKNLKNSAYAKYPDDVLAVINKIKEEYPKLTFFSNWAIVGADIGASTGIIAADKMPIHPKTIVMISPVVKAKGLYIPVNMAHLNGVDFLSISGTDDIMTKDAEIYLMRFAQDEFATFTSESKSTGMLMIKNDPGLAKMIAEWVGEYLY
ncbi:alpha/beta fold hydrolase [bacterium]|nr:alpha/beta fold hydrolase [bacterium]